MFSINFTKKNTKFCLSLHYNGTNSYLFVNSTEIIKFKAKHSEIIPYSLCLGRIQKIGHKITWTRQELMVTFMILVLITRLFQLLIF